MNIGKVYLPDTLWETMRKAFVVNIRMPSGLRTKRIVKEYGDFSREALISAVRKIERRFGGDRARNVIKMISENSLEKATEELLTYYDRNYLYGLKNFRTDRMVHVETSDPDPGKNAQVVLEAMLQYNPSYVSH
jgi:tRNA 2-selenouridine synthase